MFDAFNQELQVGHDVVAISNLLTTQTLYRGKIQEFVNTECVKVLVTEYATVTIEAELTIPLVGDEVRICLSHRLAKV